MVPRNSVSVYIGLYRHTCRLRGLILYGSFRKYAEIYPGWYSLCFSWQPKIVERALQLAQYIGCPAIDGQASAYNITELKVRQLTLYWKNNTLFLNPASVWETNEMHSRASSSHSLIVLQLNRWNGRWLTWCRMHNDGRTQHRQQIRDGTRLLSVYTVKLQPAA